MSKRKTPAPKFVWTEAQTQELCRRYPHERTTVLAAELGIKVTYVYSKACRIGLRKSAEFMATDKCGRIVIGGKLGKEQWFKPGLTPWNKGTHYQAGGRSVATQFKPGEHCGAASRNWVPVGTYRINTYGGLDRKVTDLGRGPRDWVGVHRLVWEAAHGPIPPGHVIAFKPGRKSNVLEQITPDALECITRKELASRNSQWRTNPDMARLYQLKGAITRQINRIKDESTSP